MRLVFAGTPAIAIPALTELSRIHTVTAVITREDAPVGRKRVLTPSPVAEAAHQLSLPVIKTNRLTESVTAEVAALHPELGVIVAYGGLVREPLLSLPPFGWINLHFSLLPRWRGASPVQQALIAGDKTTGASIFQLTAALDDGNVFNEIRHDISPDATAGELLEELAGIGAHLLAKTVGQIAQGAAVARPQLGEPTYAPKLTSAHGRLDLTRDFGEVYSRFRGVTPEPGAWVLFREERMKILSARRGPEISLRPGRVLVHDKALLVGTVTYPLELLLIQPFGKRAMPAAEWWNGTSGEVEFE